MGFHIILEPGLVKDSYVYVECEFELANYPINNNSIIYQGERNWKPELVRESSKYSSYSFPWHRAGIKAQIIFKDQALKAGYILEELNQDQDTFKAYTGIDNKYLKIKRGDYLIRNAANIEVDVKCRSIFDKRGRFFFEFNVEHLERHIAMKSFTHTPIIVAVYSRVSKECDNVNENSLRMFEIDYLQEYAQKNRLKLWSRKNKRGEVYKVYQFPFEMGMPSFDLIKFIMKRDYSLHQTQF